MTSDDGFNDVSNEYSLLAPGPVNLHPEVRKALALPMIHHRTPEFDKILKRVLENIKKVFQTTQEVFLLTTTGSGGMEALLVNTLSPGDKVLAIVSGKFGERWADMAKHYGASVTVLEVPWGEAVQVSLVEDHLKNNPDTRAVLCQACETSTAVSHPIRELADVISKYSETLFLVDAITALGAYPLPMDEWKIDGLVAGSQKAFMLPTGMAFISFSQKAWKFIEGAKFPRYYFDVRKEKKANASGETFFSSNVAIIRALDVVLNLIQAQGLNKLFHDIHRRAELTRIFAQKLGFTLYAKSPSDSVTALTVPSHMDGQKIRLHLEEAHNITIMGGQDQAKGKIIRVGHMGYIQDQELIRLIASLGHCLRHFDPAFISVEQISMVADEARKWLEQNP
ncbi:pyridoxal-phosphate-dependent aminotransferase family protein [Bdellovibrio svalbardensis]|uniref:Alanine--glyoxylate aminotransferase family protein n=1 Tax=Bdellovibrio svalbardensis TaxID=2972972 RepID=A0ABT6DL17_9BACT|nr:alanine--glyoxylate aminotransferase family protein [Bdellovibrio svalbardensis]MDG0817567.1 alanine--glyoxylate aminotransferase family protein [Bdellovibrio svalbardensis]